jgi:predicted MPP superfamily phosphohydrolase
MNRRKFLKMMGGLIAGSSLASAGGYWYAAHVEPEAIAVEEILVPIENLKPGLEGFKIIQLSDIHLYPFTQIEQVQAATRLIAGLQPDLIALTGDYVLQEAEAIFDLAPLLASMNARHGIFASLGNHDLWTDAAVVRSGLETAGIPVLVNAGLPLAVGADTLYVAGLDDGWSGKPDLQAALAKRPAGAPTLLLMHEPDLADDFSQDSQVTLQLSGHSHGGQVRLPGIGAPVLPPFGRKYDQGLYRVRHTWLYTNRGLGVIGPAIRFNCPPEITQFTLVRA